MSAVLQLFIDRCRFNEEFLHGGKRTDNHNRERQEIHHHEMNLRAEESACRSSASVSLAHPGILNGEEAHQILV